MAVNSAEIQTNGETDLCKRCQTREATIVVRAEPLCSECFKRYVTSKIVKRIESLKLRYSPTNPKTKFLLPLSFGVSSIALLQILDEHIASQVRRTGQGNYELHVVHVDCGPVEPSYAPAERLKNVRQQFPRHEYSIVRLHEVYGVSKESEISNINSVEAEATGHSAPADPAERLEALFHSLSSPTSRADVLSHLRTQLLTTLAKSKSCDAILWGDTTTRLAERTLAETSKGRGFSLPWQVNDGATPSGTNFRYPCRDVLKKELLSYAQLTEPPLTPLIQESQVKTTVAVNSRTTTIDDIMRQYFASVEENYPGIVANVVRTIGKLNTPEQQPVAKTCRLCGMPAPEGTFGIFGWGGEPTDAEASADVDDDQEQERLCYGCSRSMANGAELLP